MMRQETNCPENRGKVTLPTQAAKDSFLTALRGGVPDIDETQTTHMFRVRPNGLGLEDTSESRAFIREVASRPNNLVAVYDDGTRDYAAQLPDGKQVWVRIGRSGMIRNAGVNAQTNFWVQNPDVTGGFRRVDPADPTSRRRLPGDSGPLRGGGRMRFGGTLLDVFFFSVDILGLIFQDEPDPYDRTQCTYYDFSSQRWVTCA